MLGWYGTPHLVQFELLFIQKNFRKISKFQKNFRNLVRETKATIKIYYYNFKNYKNN
jgi:predicted nucleic acid-binding Zn finger protein